MQPMADLLVTTILSLLTLIAKVNRHLQKNIHIKISYQKRSVAA